MNLLTEISIQDKYTKESQMGKTKLSFEDFEMLCNLDPTTKSNQVGKYANWILAKYVPNANLNELKRCLEWYADGIKRNIIKQLNISTDINSFKTYEEFINVINQVSKSADAQISNSEYNNRTKLKGQFELIGSTSFYDIIKPLTYTAERYFGSHTEWCTVASAILFDDYKEEGPLYIIYPKNGDANMKMQFHFESDSFADKNDNVWEDARECIDNVVKNENIKQELLNVLKTIWDFRDLFSFEELVNELKQCIAKRIDPSYLFDISYDASYGLRAFTIKGYWNFLTKNGQLLSDQWFDEISEFNEHGLMKVGKNDNDNLFRYNVLKTNGKLLSPYLWFDEEGEIDDNLAVRINDEWYYIDTDKNLYSENGEFIKNLQTENVKKYHQRLIKESYKDFNITNIESIYYQINEETDEFEESYDVSAYDYDGNTIFDEYELSSFDLYRMLGETIGNKIINHEGHYNQMNNNYHLMSDDFQSYEFKDANDAAKQLFNQSLTEYYPNLHGYIMTDGECIDLGYNDHNTITRIPDINDKFEFIALGNIRCSNSTFDLIQPPTYEQKQCLRKLIANSVDLSVDIFDENGTYPLTSVMYHGKVEPSMVLGQIDRFFREGIKLNPNADSYDDDDYLYENYNNNYKTKSILKEDKRTDQAKKRCLDVIRNHFDNASWLDTVFEHQDNPDGLTHLNYMFKQFMETFYHNPQMRSSNVMRLAPLFCKLAFEANFQNNNPDNNKLQRLNSILNHIYNMGAQGKLDVSKIGLDTTYEQLNDMFGSVIDDLKRQEDERIASTTYERNSDYEIIGPIDYETAHEYGNQSCPTSKLCYTQSPRTWEQYTANGNNGVYICLKKGWKNVEPIHDGEDDSQYDTYGLSMIFVFVDETGDLAYCNTRWNHNGDLPQGFSVDHAISKEMLSKLIGVPFNSVFKPNNKWHKISDEVMKRLANGEDPRNIFDYVGGFYEGFAAVKLNDKWNFLNSEEQIAFPSQWFSGVGYFKEGFARVYLKEKGFNFINTERQYVSTDWYIGAWDFYEGFAKVSSIEGNNFINTKGQLVSPNQWFDEVDDFYEGFAEVQLRGNGYYLDTEGNLYDLSMNLIRNLKTESCFYKSSLIENYNYEYNQNDVDMSSFEKQKTLQQDLWDSEDKLNGRVRLKLLDIADDFIETLGISWIKPIDIILTGSLCNYNWSSYSDVDLHIIINFAEINEKKHFVEEYFKLKKNEWNESHQNLKIYGFNVELYVEDVENDSVHDGVYSLEKNIWIKKPFPEKLQPISNEKEEKIKYLASIALTKIEELEYEFNEPSDEIKLEKLSYKIDKLLDTLKKVRQNGLNKKGEMSVGNIIYKICRRSGYLDKLWDLKNKVYDKKNSL